MNKEKLFEHLATKEKKSLIGLLGNCYDNMTVYSIRMVFDAIEKEYIDDMVCNGEAVLKKVEQFADDSYNGVYYAPFDINWKNCSHIPEETERWFDNLADLLLESKILSKQEDHMIAIKCFEILFECIDRMCSGDSIIFADDYGLWMLGISEQPCIEAYVSSIAAINDGDNFADAILPLVNRELCQSFGDNNYLTVAQIANPKQKLALDTKMQEYKGK